MKYRTLVSTENLAAHLDVWGTVDCRFDLQKEAWGRDEYLTAHIPGAVYAGLNEDLSSERTGGNGRHPLPSVDALAATMSRLGIDRSTQVVVYDQDTGLFASRLWWLLKYLGHDAVALLDGGWAKWIRERRPTRSGPESRRPALFTPSPKHEMRIGVDDVMTRLDDRETLLVDARGADRFEGRAETIDPVAGHIPGAINHFYKWNVTDEGTMRPPDTLRENFERLLGKRTPDQVVMYCGSGVSACHNLLAMEHAGLPGAKLYPGSWSEWSSDPARPIETGPAKPDTN
jgi:thiosulfate/3-mercaptopyruvate sulfurtransferase